MIWKWHFAMGLLACPLVAIVALTGALYVFQPELDRWAHDDVMVVEPGAELRPLDELLATASRQCSINNVWIQGPPDRSYAFYCRGSERGIFLDPYRGTVLGERAPDDESVTTAVFRIVFELHWELMLGEDGRLLVEWATSWTLLLLISGAILWWPRGKRRGGGALWPRRGLRQRQWLRDLHAVFGAYALPVLFAVTATGLMWTIHAGDDRWNVIAGEGEHEHPKSKVIEGAPRVGLDRAFAGAEIDRATDHRTMWIDVVGPTSEPDAAYSFYLYDESQERPSLIESILVDAYTGAELHREGWDDRTALGKIDGARYAIHVGAFLGLPGRIAAFLAALILAALCITGPWMWWKRRPAGKLGVPPAARAPWSLYVVVAALGWILPAIGITLLALLALELLRWLYRTATARAPTGL